MFLEQNRLKSRKEIQTLFTQSKSVFGYKIILKISKNNLKDSRFAIITGTKFSKSAVVKNRSKRRIRAIIENNLQKIQKGYDILIIPNKETIKFKPEILEKTVLGVFIKAGLM